MPLTHYKCKPMLPVANRPALDYAVSRLRAAGIRDITFALGYKPYDVVDFAEGYTDINVSYSVEDEPLGTAGAVKLAAGGDTVNMNHAGKLIVNGGVQSEEIFYPTYADDAQIELPYTVEDNCVFLLCDFRTNGTDSRSYGSVPLEELDGKVIAFFRCRGI